jgi:hypothetical protein
MSKRPKFLADVDLKNRTTAALLLGTLSLALTCARGKEPTKMARVRQYMNKTLLAAMVFLASVISATANVQDKDKPRILECNAKNGFGGYTGNTIVVVRFQNGRVVQVFSL